jgi:hypothetical protein
VHERPDGQPAPADGQLLPADRRRFKLLIERSAFPSDRYAAVSQLRFHGLDPGRGADRGRATDPARCCVARRRPRRSDPRAGDTLALVLLPGVQYLSGEALDIAGSPPRRTRSARWPAGTWRTPSATCRWRCTRPGRTSPAWCSYKYLNGGPGAVAGAFVHARHGRTRPAPLRRLVGPRQGGTLPDGPDFVPMPGAEGWQLSNPPVLGMAALLAALEIFTEAGMARLREKSLALTGFWSSASTRRSPGRRRDPDAARAGAARLPALAAPARGRRAAGRGGLQAARRGRHRLRLARAGRHPRRAGAAVQPLRGRRALRRGARGGAAMSRRSPSSAPGSAARWRRSFLARRGLEVTLYERRPDLRRVPQPAGRSINLALANRGLKPLRMAGLEAETRKLLTADARPHGASARGAAGFPALRPAGPRGHLFGLAAGPERLLLDAAEAAGVRLRFGMRCTAVDFDATGWSSKTRPSGREEPFR